MIHYLPKLLVFEKPEDEDENCLGNELPIGFLLVVGLFFVTGCSTFRVVLDFTIPDGSFDGFGVLVAPLLAEL